MNLYLSYALIIISLVFLGRYLYLRWMKRNMITSIKFTDYGDSWLITGHNSQGEVLKVEPVEKDGKDYRLKFGKLTVEIANNRITKIL